MRLADVLSKSPTQDFDQVEGFIGLKNLTTGNQRKITAGKVALNYFCENCKEIRTFLSREELYCIGVNKSKISIDCVLNCPCCDSSVQIWFLVGCDSDIAGQAPNIRIIKRNEKLSDKVRRSEGRYGLFSEFLEKAQRAHHEGLGAGAMVYLRKIFEQITTQTAIAEKIDHLKSNGKPRPFGQLLQDVDAKRSIIPREFSANGYKLFGELSDVVHGEYDEELALGKYESLHRLIVGILDNVKNNRELLEAVNALGLNEE